MGDTATTDEEVSYGNLAVGRSQLNGGPDSVIEPTSPLLVRTDPAIPEVTNIVEVRDPNVVRVFNNLRAFIWQRGTTLEWWEQHFGAVREGAIYGERFWPGFFHCSSNTFHCRSCGGNTPKTLALHIFKKPAFFSRLAVSRPLCQDNPSDQDANAVYPCFCVPWLGQFYAVVCIRTVIGMSKPWTVHESWLVITNTPTQLQHIHNVV